MPARASWTPVGRVLGTRPPEADQADHRRLLGRPWVPLGRAWPVEEADRVRGVCTRSPDRGGTGLQGERPLVALAELVDIYPTLADLCGLLPANLQGQACVPCSTTPTRRARPRLTQVSRAKGGAERPHRRLAVHRGDEGKQGVGSITTPARIPQPRLRPEHADTVRILKAPSGRVERLGGGSTKSEAEISRRLNPYEFA